VCVCVYLCLKRLSMERINSGYLGHIYSDVINRCQVRIYAKKSKCIEATLCQ